MPVSFTRPRPRVADGCRYSGRQGHATGPPAYDQRLAHFAFFFLKNIFFYCGRGPFLTTIPHIHQNRALLA